VGPRTGLDAVVKIKKSHHWRSRELNPGRPALNLVPIFTELVRQQFVSELPKYFLLFGAVSKTNVGWPVVDFTSFVARCIPGVVPVARSIMSLRGSCRPYQGSIVRQTDCSRQRCWIEKVE